MLLSIVATMYRSAAYLDAFHARIVSTAEPFGEFEIVLVNDGSPDESLQKALALRASDPRVVVVDLSRNFGHHKAMMTGLDHARGEKLFLIDCDLEEEPELLKSFDEEMRRTGADVVFGVQARRKGGRLERWSGDLFFRLFNLLSDDQITPNLSTVRLMTRRYVDALLAHRERSINIGGLWVITGFSQVGVPINKAARGSTTYTLAHKVDVFVNAVTSFSDKPLRLIFYLGMAIFVLALVAAVDLVVRRVFLGVLLAGWPSLMVSVWLLGGLTLFSLGVIGIYLQKVFLETKQRPYTIVRAVHGGNAHKPSAEGPRR